ncbi:MAG TPA: cupin domain-containing protein [Nitrospiraceae bacterium]|nr:cupin domain-containing protein [Nitrospiraceae bacterium]
MFKTVQRRDLTPSGSRTAKFEGESYGAGVSFFLVDNDPGQGPELHRHPYPETWIVLSGEALITADGVAIEAREGDIVVVGAQTPHKFRNTGTNRLEIACIHASPRMIQESLEE